jgi:hypothetical protein
MRACNARAPERQVARVCLGLCGEGRPRGACGGAAGGRARPRLHACDPGPVCLEAPEHKDHIRAVGMVLDRTDPVETRSRVDVTIKALDPDDDAIEELRALRALGMPRASTYGSIG